MRPQYKRLIPIVAALFVAAVAIADDLADFKKWYAAGMPAMTKAMESKNIGAIEKSTTKDFTYTESSGKSSDKKTALAGLKQMMDTAQKLKYTPKILGYKSAKGGMAVELTEAYNITMKPGPDKKTHMMVVMSKVRETWVKSGGTWLLKNITEIAPAKMSVDGKAPGG